MDLSQYSDDELMAVAGKPAAPKMSVRDHGLMVRTVLGEAAGEDDEGQAAVAAVIRNRLNSGRYGKSVEDVVLAKNQFEPWNTDSGRARMLGVPTASPTYQRAAAAVDRVMGGYDPTKGATHFYAPQAQA